MLQQIQIRISEGYKPYSQHVILSALLMAGYATGILAPVFLGYLIYYSFRVVKIVGWKKYWKIDWMLPVGWTWNFALVISFALAPGEEITTYDQLTTYDVVVALFFLFLMLAVFAWGMAVIILAAKRGTLNHFAFLAGPAKSSSITTSEIKRLFAPDTSSKLQVRK